MDIETGRTLTYPEGSMARPGTMPAVASTKPGDWAIWKPP